MNMLAEAVKLQKRRKRRIKTLKVSLGVVLLVSGYILWRIF